MSSPLGLTFETTNIGKYNVYNGGSVGGYKTGKKVKSLFGRSVFAPFPTAIDKNGNVLEILKASQVHNDDTYDTSIPSLVKYTQGEKNKSMRLTFADFAYLKDVGVYPNNRLIIARRFPGPVGNDLHAVKSSPLATMISWIPEGDDSFFNMSFNEKWTEAEASYTDVLNDIGSDTRLSKDDDNRIGDFLASGMIALPFPGFSEPLQRLVFNKLGLVEDPYNLPLGNPNLIREAKRRQTVGKDDPGSGLSADIQITMNVEYEQKFINGVDPTLVYLDIIQNALTFGTSDASFQFNSAFGNSTSKLIQNLVSGKFSAIFEALKEVVTELFNQVKEIVGKLVDALITPPKTDPISIGRDGLVKLFTAAFDISTKSFSAIIGKYKVRLLGITNALTGNPSTPWHITIGNPKKPVFSSGDMLLSKVEMELGQILAFNDLPSSIKFKLTFENARSLGAQEIFNRLNTGKGRSYIRVNLQKEGTSQTTQDTPTSDQGITTYSIDEAPLGGKAATQSDTLFATINGPGSSSAEWLDFSNNGQSVGGGPVNVGESLVSPNGQLQNPSDLNKPSLTPSNQSGLGTNANKPAFIGAIQQTPTQNLGQTPLTPANVTSVSTDELTARKENLSNQSKSLLGQITSPFNTTDINTLTAQSLSLNNEIKLINDEEKRRAN